MFSVDRMCSRMTMCVALRHSACVCIHVYVYMYVQAARQEALCVYLHTYLFTCTCAYIYIHICVYVRAGGKAEGVGAAGLGGVRVAERARGQLLCNAACVECVFHVFHG